MALLEIETLLTYLFAFLLQLLRVLDISHGARWIFILLCILALGGHAELLHRWIDLSHGQNLTTVNLMSFVMWFIALTVILTAIWRPVANLILFIFPLSILSIIAVIFHTQEYVIDTGSQPALLVHIVFSTLSFSLFFVAGLQSLLVGVKSYEVRKFGRLVLPPLESMEQLIFTFIGIGMILYTITLVITFYQYLPLLFVAPYLKLILSLAAWFVFAMVLYGHYFKGWRGKMIQVWIFLGLILLTCVFFGNNYLGIV